MNRIAQERGENREWREPTLSFFFSCFQLEKMVRVFQIGFNKCGTSSIHATILAAGHRSLHFKKGEIARTFCLRKMNKKRLIPKKWNNVVLFSDMEDHFEGHYAYMLFKILDKQYPGSKFILNTRNRERWIESRIKHRGYLEVDKKRRKMSTVSIIALWKQQWDFHHSDVLSYFKNRPQDLLVLDIETCDGRELARFLPRLKLGSLLHKNKTREK